MLENSDNFVSEKGIVIICNPHTIKLTNKSSSSIQWLASYLESIENPKSHLMLDPTPLSSILVPMTRDYLVYWGALVTNHCSHTIMWIISRAAMAITVEDLNKFRKLQNNRSEAMTKNFREATAQQGRIIFHANPSAECKHLLHPGTIEPPGKPLLVNYSHIPELDSQLAKSIFNSGVGDCSEKMDDKLSTTHSNDIKCEIKKNSKKSSLHDEKNKLKLRNNSVNSGSNEKPARSRASSTSPTNRTDLRKRKLTDKQKENKDYQQSRGIIGEEVKPEKNKEVICTKAKSVKQDEHLNICISKASMSADSSIDQTQQTAQKVIQNESKTHQNLPKTPKNLPKPRIKTSQLPVPKNVKNLKSSLAQYFQSRPESASSEKTSQKLVNKPSTPKPRARNVATSIRKPIGINAGKLSSNRNETS